MTDETPNNPAPAPSPEPQPAPAPAPAPEPSPSPAPADEKKATQLMFNDDTVEGGTKKDDKKTDDTTEGGDKKDGQEEVKYELKLPEEMEVKQERLDKFTQYAKEKGIAPEAAQGLVDLYVDMQKEELAAWDSLLDGWASEVKNDPTYGGAKLDASLKASNDIVRKFGDQELKERVLMLGLGNSLPFVRFLNKIHAATSDDNIAGAGKEGAEPPKKTAAQILYPHMA